MKTGITAIVFLCSLNGTGQAINDVPKYKGELPQQTSPVVTNYRTPPGRYARLSSRQKEESSTKVLDGLDAIGDLATNEVYQVSVAADIPDNSRPGKVYFKKEPGHVFVILEKRDTVTGVSVAQSWGFYPVRPVTCLFLRTVKCEILDNGGRQYDAAITHLLTKAQFDFVKEKAMQLAQKKYNLNKYNCYEYAVELYNAIPGVTALTMTKVKFPFIFGRGGSPCGLYSQLRELSGTSQPAQLKISFGLFRSPVSHTQQASNGEVAGNGFVGLGMGK